jgi:hypothetical protein
MIVGVDKLQIGFRQQIKLVLTWSRDIIKKLRWTRIGSRYKASVSTYSRLMTEIVIHALDLSPDISTTNDHLPSLFSSFAIVTLDFAFR